MVERFAKKGQLDTFIIGFVAFLLLIVVIGAFMIFSLSLSNLKGNKEIISSESFSSSSSNPLLQQIEFSFRNESQKTLVADALIFVNRKNIYSSPELESALKTLVNAEKPCLLLAYSSEQNPAGRTRSFFEGGLSNYIQIYYKYDFGKVGSSLLLEKVFAGYYSNKIFHSASIIIPSQRGNKILYVDYYYGSCMEDGNA